MVFYYNQKTVIMRKKIFFLFFLISISNSLFAQKNKVTIEPVGILRTGLGRPLSSDISIGFRTVNFSKYVQLGCSYEKKITKHFSGTISFYMRDFYQYGENGILYTSPYSETKNTKGTRLQIRFYEKKDIDGLFGGIYYHWMSDTYVNTRSSVIVDSGTNKYNIFGIVAGYSYVTKKGLILESAIYLGRTNAEMVHRDFKIQLNMGYSF